MIKNKSKLDKIPLFLACCFVFFSYVIACAIGKTWLMEAMEAMEAMELIGEMNYMNESFDIATDVNSGNIQVIQEVIQTNQVIQAKMLMEGIMSLFSMLIVLFTPLFVFLGVMHFSNMRRLSLLEASMQEPKVSGSH